MPSLKRPNSGMVSSSRVSAVSQSRQVDTDSEDLFASSPSESIGAIPSSSTKNKQTSSAVANKAVLKDDSEFCKILSDAGIILFTDDSPNLLSTNTSDH